MPSKVKPLCLLIASYAFYASWDYRFLSLIIISTLIDFLCGYKIYHSQYKKRYLYLSIISNIGILLIFKSYNFFIDEFISLLNIFELNPPHFPLKIILPLGISFYTFQTLTYSIDIYRQKLKPEKSLIVFGAFISFFPQLIAGPIERASKLLPQIKNPIPFSQIQFEKGIYLIAYGFFKKRVIADYMAIFVEQGFQSANATPTQSLIALLAFTIQIYCDVSGYTHMARGFAYLLGIELSKNFHFPYFSTNPSDFWSKWHRTLSFWVRDYVYMPLLIRIKNPYFCTIVSFIVMGAWLGFKSTNFIWGLYWGMVICTYQILKKYKLNRFSSHRFLSISLMMILVIIGHSLFRSSDTESFIQIWTNALNITNLRLDFFGEHFKFFYLITFLFVCEFFQFFYKQGDEYAIIKQNILVKILFYIILLFSYRNIGYVAENSFIYFNH